METLEGTVCPSEGTSGLTCRWSHAEGSMAELALEPGPWLPACDSPLLR